MTMDLIKYNPTEYNVLVRLERATEKRGSLYMPDEKVERDQAMNIRGVLVKASPLAFTYDSWDNVPDDEKPQVGDRVVISKGAGLYITDKESGDGEFYRFIKDKDVVAAWREPVKQAKAA